MKSLAELRPLPDDLRHNWGRAYQHWHVNPPSPAYLSDMQRLKDKAGITDRLIVAVLERGLTQRKPHVIAWAKTVLEGLVPYGITTPEEWAEFETERDQCQPTVGTTKAQSSLDEWLKKRKDR